jgi:two-component system LytT family response regulator
MQVHRSEVVNLAAIAKLEPWTYGDGILVLADGSTVVVTRTHRRRFLERFVGS